MENIIVNRVAESGLVTIDLEEFYSKDEIIVFDLKDHLFRGLILREKDFRAALQVYEWEQFRDKLAAITCSADAIIPMWAYMLVASNLQPYAKKVLFGDEKSVKEKILLENLSKVRGEEYADKRVIVKGCGDLGVPEAAYVEITNILRPYVKSIMYGEACSNVPIFKRK